MDGHCGITAAFHLLSRISLIALPDLWLAAPTKAKRETLVFSSRVLTARALFDVTQDGARDPLVIPTEMVPATQHDVRDILSVQQMAGAVTFLIAVNAEYIQVVELLHFRNNLQRSTVD